MMLAYKEDFEKIAKHTGLTLEEVKALDERTHW